MKNLKKILLFFFLINICFLKNTFSQNKIDKKLESKLKLVIDSFHGNAGLYVFNLKTQKEVAINADTIFPTASIIKLPILIELFDKIQQGVFTYHQPFIYHDSIARGGSGFMQFFKDTSKVTLSDIVSMMITYSDNTAAVWCEKLAGGGVAVNQWLKSNSFEYTRLNSRTPNREKEYNLYGWGQTTPREMAKLLMMLREGKIISAAASEKMYRLLTHIYWDDYALSQIPPYVQSASKQGMVNASRSEAVMVNAPHGDYIFYIATKNNEDQRWEPNNEAWKLIRKISSMLWNYFEPNYNWTPPANIDSYLK